MRLLLQAQYIFPDDMRTGNRFVNDSIEQSHLLNCRVHPKALAIISCLFFLMMFPFALFAQQQTITLQFQNIVNNRPLQQDSLYTNAFGEIFTIRTFRYYISNIVLLDEKQQKSQSYPEDYFLIDEVDTSTKKIVLATTLQHISSLQFLLGVDSLKNASGVQSGSLDPAMGMFWTWNTGYVMAKLEGNSPVAHTPAHAFSYHVGGYKRGEAAARTIHLAVPGKQFAAPGQTILINASVDAWFNAAHPIKISETPFCHEPGAFAYQLADNYANMFSIATE